MSKASSTPELSSVLMPMVPKFRARLAFPV
jgi:hypothetical protein